MSFPLAYHWSKQVTWQQQGGKVESPPRKGQWTFIRITAHPMAVSTTGVSHHSQTSVIAHVILAPVLYLISLHRNLGPHLQLPIRQFFLVTLNWRRTSKLKSFPFQHFVYFWLKASYPPGYANQTPGGHLWLLSLLIHLISTHHSQSLFNCTQYMSLDYSCFFSSLLPLLVLICMLSHSVVSDSLGPHGL